MTLHVTVAGRTTPVDIRRDGDRFLVWLNGRAHRVDVKVINGVWSMLVGPPDEDLSAPNAPTRSYEVAFSPSPAGKMAVRVNGVPVEVSISRMPPAGARTAIGSANDAPQRIAAPMPGKVVKLLVKAGDTVEPRQGLVVVEAMKMENELRAHAAGTVAEVRVTEGSSVEAGAILVILE